MKPLIIYVFVATHYVCEFMPAMSMQCRYCDKQFMRQVPTLKQERMQHTVTKRKCWVLTTIATI